jgi:hypothetical protein
VERELSEISLGAQVWVGRRGSSIDPSRMEVEKHSLMYATSFSDFCHEYQRQASPGSQNPCWAGSSVSNCSQEGPEEAENNDPHLWHFTRSDRLLTGAEGC